MPHLPTINQEVQNQAQPQHCSVCDCVTLRDVDLKLRLASLAKGTSDLLGERKQCFEGFVSPRISNPIIDFNLA